MLRFVTYALPLLILLLALFGFAVGILDFEPQQGSVIKLALFDQPTVPAQLVLGTWLVEASGLLALFLLAQGRCGAWWLDGLVAGWLGWVFRGPLLVVTIVVAARQPQHAWWTLAFGWWVLYSVCGLALSILARRTELDLAIGSSGSERRHLALKTRRDAAASAALAAAPPSIVTEDAPAELEPTRSYPEPELSELSASERSASEPSDLLDESSSESLPPRGEES